MFLSHAKNFMIDRIIICFVNAILSLFNLVNSYKIRLRNDISIFDRQRMTMVFYFIISIQGICIELYRF